MPTAREYLAEVEGGENPFAGITVEKGGAHGGGTWAHKLVAVEYARYLSPAFAVFVNNVFLAVTEGPQPGVAIAAPSTQIDEAALARIIGAIGAQITAQVGTMLAPLAMKVSALDMKMEHASGGDFHTTRIGKSRAKTLSQAAARVVLYSAGKSASARRSAFRSLYTALGDYIEHSGVGRSLESIPEAKMDRALHFFEVKLHEAKAIRDRLILDSQQTLPIRGPIPYVPTEKKAK